MEETNQVPASKCRHGHPCVLEPAPTKGEGFVQPVPSCGVCREDPETWPVAFRIGAPSSRLAPVLVALLLLAGLFTGCITKAEYRADVKAWRSYYDATKADLYDAYGRLDEPMRSNRLETVNEEEKTIAAAEQRAGIASPGTSTTPAK